MKGQQIDMFHNTIQLLPSEKVEREKKALNQNEKILAFFKENPMSDFTPAEVWLKFGQQYPLTSIRRAISDLTKAGDLIKTDLKRKGIYNEINCVWKLKR
jgi:hypothetical protein